MSPRAPQRWRWVAAAALAGAVLVAFWPALSAGFTNFDDRKYVTDNPRVREGLTLDGIRWAWTTFHASNWHPVTWLSHMLDQELYGSSPAGHHLTSVLLHLANTVLLMLVLERATGRLGRSAFVAMLFGLHPLHVESVAWVAERKDVLSTLFGWLTVLAWLRWTEAPRPSRYAWVVVAFALALASKPMLVTLPFVLVLLDVWPLGRRDPRTPGWWHRALVEKLPLVGLSVASGVVTFVAQRSGEAMDTLERLPPAARAANAVVAFVVYLRKTVWPSDLAVFYPHPGAGLSVSTVVLCATLLAMATVAALRSRRRYLAVGWLWYLGTLVPVIGLVQVGRQAFADRYTYVPLVGIFIIVAWGVPDACGALAARWRGRAVRPLAWLAAVTAPVLIVLTWTQAARWRDSETLFRHALAVTQANAVAHNNLGLALAETGRLEEAVEQYGEALRIDPSHASAHANLGLALAGQGRHGEAIERYRRAVELDPGRPEIHNNLGLSLIGAGRAGDAVDRFREALRLDPEYAPAQGNLGIALAALGRRDDAIEAYRRAVELDPGFAEAHNNLGLALAADGRNARALAAFDAAVAARPDYAQAHSNRAAALYLLGRYAEAWDAVRRSRSLGLEPPERFLALLREVMPEPDRGPAP